MIAASRYDARNERHAAGVVQVKSVKKAVVCRKEARFFGRTQGNAIGREYRIAGREASVLRIVG